ncbi:MAG: (Fe-S)-binding protein, partial [Rikenellaceae bacterium]
MFAIIIAKYSIWIYRLAPEQRALIGRGIFSLKSLAAVGEIFSESLLHRKIFKVNPLLGYMHMSLAFGWFLLICTGWAETFYILGDWSVPPQGHVFFRYFA